MDRRSGQNAEQRGRPVTTLEAAKANDCFDQFLYASTLKTILGTYRNICDLLHLKPNVVPLFYPKLKANLTTWKAKALWKKFDLRANNKIYGKGKLCPHTRVLIIGAGPCGLRSAIEAQLLGAKVVVVEKRDRISRNNVLHLWPFVIDDLRSLGAKKFFGKFCAGSIDHISIRQLQCILLKVALLLGVEIHTEVSFEGLIEPNLDDKTGWRADFKPAEHPVSQFEFDVIIGADGKRNTLQGFKRKEFRGKLAIAITANFINKRSEAEARVEEISGVAFIFNQKFFKDLYAKTGIDLENIVYYKDDTHYFVMTAKKQSLIEKGVIKRDLADTAKLLSHDNVDRDALHNYAREAAEFSTNYNMLDLEFAVNHYGQPDVAMFDFTSMYAAENASRIIERHGYKLFTILVGDSLLEPFWPTGSGCARGFLSSMDAGWSIRGYGSGLLTPLEVIAERESIYRLLAQTTPENLNKDYKSYTLDPSTRYPNLNKNLLLPQQALALYDTDDPNSILHSRTPMTTTVVDMPKKRRRRDTHVDPDTLLSWVKEQVREHKELNVQDVTKSFKDGRILCAIISHYRPDLLDYSAINSEDSAKTNQMVFDLLEKEIGIPPVMTGAEMANSDDPDYLTMVSYLTQIYDAFRCEIPHIKHPKLKKVAARKLKTSENKINIVPKFNKHRRIKSQAELLKFPDSNWEINKYLKLLKKSPLVPPPPVFQEVSTSTVANIQTNHISQELSSTCISRTKMSSKVKNCEKSKFSLINRSLEYSAELNLAPIKSIEEYGPTQDNLCNTNFPIYCEKYAVVSTEEKVRHIEFYDKNIKDKDKLSEGPQPLQSENSKSLILKISESNFVENKRKCTLQSENSAKVDFNFPNKGPYINERNNKYHKHNVNANQSNREINNFGNGDNKNNFEKVDEPLIPSDDESEIDIIIDDGYEESRVIFNSIKNQLEIFIPKVVDTLRFCLGLNGVNPGAREKTNKHSYFNNVNFERKHLGNMGIPQQSKIDKNQVNDEGEGYSRVKNWISGSDFRIQNTPSKHSIFKDDNMSDITDLTSVTSRQTITTDTTEEPIIKNELQSDEGKVKEKPNIPENATKSSSESISAFLEDLKKIETISGELSTRKRRYKRSKSVPPTFFEIIKENEESDFTETKRHESAFTKNHPALLKKHVNASQSPMMVAVQGVRSNIRHKKRKTNEKINHCHVLFQNLLPIFARGCGTFVLVLLLDIVLNFDQYGLETLLF